MKKSILIFILLCIPVSVSANQLTLLENDEIVEQIQREYFEQTYIDPIFIDERKMTNFINKLNEKITKQPVDASFDKNGEIIEGKLGIKLNKDKMKKLLLHYFYEKGSATIEIPTINIYPRVSGELLAEINDEKIGHYTTYYNQNNKERSHNIFLSAVAINHHVIFPDETFSFNQVVGERTIDKGYQRAPVIVKGELSEDIGGGICQVSSTLFNAVNLRGIQMIERYSHSREVPYVPPGKDAAVSWWGPDFAFKNNYSHPILIKATAKNGVLEIIIYSAGDAYTK